MKIFALFTITVLFSINTFASHSTTAQPDNSVSLEGSVDGYRSRDFDDDLEFGLIIPTLRKEQILNFNLASVLSPKTSVIRAGGQKINVPSNLSLPRQRESYWITIRINKPSFILPIYSEELPDSVAVLDGSIPFDKTVKTLRAGSPLFSVINDFTFKSFSLAPVVSLDDKIQMTAGDVDINGGRLLFKIPFRTDRDFVSLGLTLHSTVGSSGETNYFPVGIKTLKRPQRIAYVSEGDIPLIVSIPKRTFDSSAQDNANAVFPFSLVWGESEPVRILPLAKNFVTFKNKILSVDQSKLVDFKVSAFQITVYDVNKDIVLEESFTDFIDMDLSSLVGATRIRLDVLAVDHGPFTPDDNIDPSISMIDAAFNNAKYISRYEQDIN